MTNALVDGYESPRGHGELDTGPVAEPSTGSVPDTAKDQAAKIGRSAKESGQKVAGTAGDEAKNLVGEARRQATDLSQEVSSQAQQQAAVQKDKAASGLQSLGEELRSMAQQGGQSGPVTDLAHGAADKVTDLATWLEARDPGTLLEEMRGFARRKPGTFLLFAATAGIVVGRLARGVVQASKDDGDNTTVGGRSNASAGHGTDMSSAETNGRSAASYGSEATPIADMTAAATTRLTPAVAPYASGDDEASRRAL